MALSALTLTVSKAISGRRFRSKLNGLTAGTTVEVDRGASSSGFGELNGFLVNPCVAPLDLPTVAVITERVPGTGENRTTKLIIEVLSQNEVRRQSEELGTFRQPYAAPQEDGSELWTIRAGGVGGEPVDETAGVEVPAAVSDLTATAVSDTEIEIDWTAAVGATSHQYRLDGGTATTATGPPMTIADLDSATEYDFEVRGVNGDGNGTWSNVASETTESGGSPYTTAAVAFDQATWLSRAELACTDNGLISMSCWLGINAPEVSGQSMLLWVVDPLADYANFIELEGVDFDDGPGAHTPDGVFANFGQSGLKSAGTTIPVSTNGGWSHILVSVDFANSWIKIYQDGVDITKNPFSYGSPTTPAINGKDQYIGSDTYGVNDSFVGQMADMWLAPGQSLLNGSGVIPPATIAKFLSGGKPVSLGADGSTPTGTAPAIFLRRAPAAAASTFASNLGTGGAFTITGTLTNAPSSPSD